MTTQTPHSADPLSNLPGPPPVRWLGPIGNVAQFARDSIGYSRQLFATYGTVVSLAAGGKTNLYSPLDGCPGTVLTYGPEAVRQVASQNEAFFKFPLSGRWYRKRHQSKRTEPLKHFFVGLFGLNGEEHRQHRHLMMPAFHRQRIESYRDEIVRLTQSTLDTFPVGESIDIASVMRLLTLRVATRTLFGEDVGTQGGNPGQLLQDSLNLLASPQIVLLPFDLPGLPYHRLLNLIAEFDSQMRAIIRRKRTSGNLEPDVLSMLIQAQDAESGEGLSEDELLGHTGVLFAAGHETSANALTWTLFLLSQHPTIAAQLLDELVGVLKGDAPTVEQLAQLPFLEAVVKESLRVLPPVPWNGRVLSQATTMAGYTLPAGTEVFVSLYQTHQIPELYPQPRRFNPNRWATINPTAFEYNPFSAGPRTCIGAAFAMMEIKIILATLLQRFRLQCVPNLRVDRTGALIVMAPKQGMPMRVFQQDRQFRAAINVRGNIREMLELPE